MKKSSIIGIVVIAIAIAVIVSSAGDASSYVTFGEAKEMAQSGSDDKIHVVGELKKNSAGQVIGVSQGADLVSTNMVMVDEDGREQEVLLKQPMPADLLRSEKVVVIGAYHDNLFVADKVLLKCPSKYEETSL